MKNTLLIFLSLFIIFTALLLIAQEKENPEKVIISSLKNPSEDHIWAWMVGEWKGWSESQIGKTKDYMKVEWGLNKQFIITHLHSEVVEVNEEELHRLSKKMRIPVYELAEMIEQPYYGHGYSTINLETNEILNYWFDSNRGFFRGTELRDGSEISISLEGPIQMNRKIKKVSYDKMMGSFRNFGKQEIISEGVYQMTRVN